MVATPKNTSDGGYGDEYYDDGNKDDGNDNGNDDDDDEDYDHSSLHVCSPHHNNHCNAARGDDRAHLWVERQGPREKVDPSNHTVDLRHRVTVPRHV